MTASLTPWFPASVKPVRVGYYKTIDPERNRYAYWTGEYWSFQVLDCQHLPPMYSRAAFQNKRWRGLSEKPK